MHDGNRVNRGTSYAAPVVATTLATAKLLTINEVLIMVRVSRSTWLRGVRARRFPSPVRLANTRRVFWRRAEIVALLDRPTPLKLNGPK